MRAGAISAFMASKAGSYIRTGTSSKGRSKAASNSQPRRLQLE